MPFSICIFRFDMTLKNTNVMRNTNQHKKVIYSACFSAFNAVLTSLTLEQVCSSLVANNKVLYVPYILKTFAPSLEVRCCECL